MLFPELCKDLNETWHVQSHYEYCCQHVYAKWSCYINLFSFSEQRCMTTAKQIFARLLKIMWFKSSFGAEKVQLCNDLLTSRCPDQQCKMC